jgi:hypothetical protein
MGFRFPNILYNNHTRTFSHDGYRPTREHGGTFLICLDCPTEFFHGEIINSVSRDAFVAAAQVAETHGKQLGHRIHRSDPEHLL